MKLLRFVAPVGLSLALLALIMAFMARSDARRALNTALSEIEIEERNALTLPIYDEGTQKYSYLAIYEVSVNHCSGPAITLERLEKASLGSGYLVALQGTEVVPVDFASKFFLVSQSLNEIRRNPRMLKEITASDIGDYAQLDLELGVEQTKTVRFGVLLDVYDPVLESRAEVVLISYRFVFSNGKTSIFRRALPIQPVKKPS